MTGLLMEDEFVCEFIFSHLDINVSLRNVTSPHHRGGQARFLCTSRTTLNHPQRQIRYSEQ